MFTHASSWPGRRTRFGAAASLACLLACASDVVAGERGKLEPLEITLAQVEPAQTELPAAEGPTDTQPVATQGGGDPQKTPTETGSKLSEDEPPPSETTDAAPGVVLPPPEIGPTETTMEACADEDAADPTMIERVRRRLTVTACASSAWLDSLFGSQVQYDQYRETYGSVSAGSLWSEYDGFDPRLRFRVRLQLPQWDEHVSAFAGRVGEEDYISDTEGDFDALPTRQFGGLEDESVLVGLGYSSPTRTGNDFDVGVGVRIDVPLDPYAQARYEIVRTFAERYVFRARETGFWRNTEGFGSTTRINLDRALSDRMLVRLNNIGKFTEETNGLEWVSELTLFQSVGARTGLAWQGYVNGVTDNEVQITRYGFRLIMRRQLKIEYLFLELRGGAGWPRRWLNEDRDMSLEAGIALEMQFGNKENRRGI